MIEPLDVVYVAQVKATSAYHRAPTDREVRRGHIEGLTKCGRLQLEACDQRPEILAVLTREPCSHCFVGQRNRRRIIQKQMAEIPEEAPGA